MINNFLILIYVWLAFIAMAFWESSCEGRNAWDRGKVGWKIRIGKYVVLTRYHFWLNIMVILFLLLPIIVYGFNLKLFGVLLSAYFSGFVVEDFFWYVFNPVVNPLKDFARNPPVLRGG